jgi:hypothetical protein
MPGGAGNYIDTASPEFHNLAGHIRFYRRRVLIGEVRNCGHTEWLMGDYRMKMNSASKGKRALMEKYASGAGTARVSREIQPCKGFLWP